MAKDFIKYQLPETWTWTTLNALGTITSGGTPSTKQPQFWNGNIPWITPADLSEYKEKFISMGRRNISDAGLNYSSAVLLPKGSILFSSRAPIGYVVIAKNELTTNQGFKNLIPLNSVSSDYVYYYLKSSKQLAEDLASGTTFLELSAANFSKIPIPLPPLPEQIRIVAKIEELFSELDHAEESLIKVQKQLELGKQILLKDAFEGKLTIGWRNENKSPKKLTITTIRAIKESLYQTKLEASSTLPKGNNLPKLKKLNHLQPLNDSDIKELPKVPKEWLWVKLSELSHGVEYGSSIKSQRKGKIPVIRMGNIQNYAIDWTDLVFTSNDAEIIKYALNKGDILFNRTNSPELVGKTGLFQGERDAIFAGYLIRLNQITELIDAKYLNYFLNSPLAKLHGNKIKTDAVNQSNINGEKLINYPIPLTSLEEQIEVVQQLEYHLTTIENLNKTTNNLLKKIEVSKYSILKKAFTGKLVENEIGDGTGEDLLRNLKEEKEKYILNKVQPATKMKKEKLMNNSLIDVLRQNFKGKQFTYEEIKDKALMAYEDIKNQLFELIEAGEKISSKFNKSKGKIFYTLKNENKKTKTN